MRGNPRIVVIGSTEFASRVPLGEWQLARAFGRIGLDVSYVDPPRARLIGQTRFGLRAATSQLDGIRVVSCAGLCGSRPWLATRLQDRLFAQQLNAALGPTEPVLLVATTPTRGSVQGVRRDFLIYWQKDRDWALADQQNLDWTMQRHLELLRSANVVTAVSQEIVADNAQQGVAALHIPNGVDVDYWSTPTREPPDLAHIGRPRLLFLGAWSSRVDKHLLAELSARLPSAQFVVLGAIQTDIVSEPNVHYLGSRPYDALAAYAQHCDVGLIPYVPDSYNRGSDPLKLLEYLASGIPVVGTDGVISGDLPSVRRARGVDSWVEHIQTLLTSKADPTAGRAYAVANTWDSRARALLQLAFPLVSQLR